jgi:hypothetical protein
MNMTTIDMSPTWESLIPIMLLVAKEGSSKGQAEMRKEFVRMAKAADRWHALQREES